MDAVQEKIVRWFHDDRWLRVDSLVFAVDNQTGATICLGKYEEVLKGLQEKEEQKIDERTNARTAGHPNIQLGDTKTLKRHREISRVETAKVREVKYPDIRRTRNSSPHERQIRASQEHGAQQYPKY